MKVCYYADSDYNNWYWVLEDDNKHYKYVICAKSSFVVSTGMNEARCRLLLCMAERDGLTDSMEFETEIPKDWVIQKTLFNGRLSDWIKERKIEKEQKRINKLNEDF